MDKNINIENDPNVNDVLPESASEEISENEKEDGKINKRHKRSGIIITALLVFSIILCIWVISQVLGKGYISVGGYSMFRVATGSMEPEIPVGTLLISKNVSIDDIDVGDIINFRSKETGMVGKVITHRVIAQFENEDGRVYLETKGDANVVPDALYVEQDNLVGKVVFTTGKGNFFAGIVNFLTSSIGFWACIVFPCMLIGVFVMKDVIGNLREELESITKELDGIEKKSGKERKKQPETEETYEQMCERLRNELLEELKQSAENADAEEKEGVEEQK